jgi:hypothetical protein
VVRTSGSDEPPKRLKPQQDSHAVQGVSRVHLNAALTASNRVEVQTHGRHIEESSCWKA